MNHHAQRMSGPFAYTPLMFHPHFASLLSRFVHQCMLHHVDQGLLDL